MKHISLLFLSAFFLMHSLAQQPDDALRNAWFVPSGSARSMAIGGAITSLGGDITSNHINPAGIGLYKTRELIISPGWNINNNAFNYRDSLSANENQAFNYGTIGFVIGMPSNDKWRSQAFSVSINQLASYNNTIRYKGFNNASSFSEQYLEELTADNASYHAALYNYIYGASLAFNTYLIDTFHTDGVFAGYKSLVPLGGDFNPFDGVMQTKTETTSGGFHELSVAYAANMDDKLYLGGSLNFPIVSFNRTISYNEKDISGDLHNHFNYFDFQQKFKSRGFGMNLKLGFIYKPAERFRIGFSFHTPSIISFRDQITYAAITTDTENFKGVQSMSSDDFEKTTGSGMAQYRQITPWRALAGISYVFNEVKNTKKQRAFITADVEFVNYRGSRFLVNDENDDIASDYYKAVNNTIKNHSKGNINLKVGAELKFDPVMFRIGAAHYGSPYKNRELNASRNILSAGIGFRKFGFFIDLTYAYTFVKDVNFPYRLNDVSNTFANQSGNKSTALVTLGYKF